MNETVAIAAMGYLATLSAAGFAAWWRGKSDRQGRILDAKVQVYGECSLSLYEYERASYNRTKTRLAGSIEDDRQPLREEAYKANTRARSSIGQVAILSGDEGLAESLSTVRKQIGEYSDAQSTEELTNRHRRALKELDVALATARRDLTANR